MATLLETDIAHLSENIAQQYAIPAQYFEDQSIKRGLRNADGTGVLIGVSKVGSVQGYYMMDGERVPMPGKLYYRGISVEDIVEAHRKSGTFGYEEVAYLLLLGSLPTQAQQQRFNDVMARARTMPAGFTEDMILKAPSRNIMNQLARSVLALYSYDDRADDTALDNVLRQSIGLIARFPLIAANAFAAKRHYFDGDSLILHAEHSSNNSTFVCRAMTSSGTDTYSAIAGAVGSLKGPLHGGANAKVMQMFRDIREHVGEAPDDASLDAYLDRILDGEAGDRSGKIYGLGHAVYTMSDPRAVVIKKYAASLAGAKGRRSRRICSRRCSPRPASRAGARTALKSLPPATASCARPTAPCSSKSRTSLWTHGHKKRENAMHRRSPVLVTCSSSSPDFASGSRCSAIRSCSFCSACS